MKYNINLFGNNFDCQLVVQDNQIKIEMDTEDQKALRSYLERVLIKYSGGLKEESASLGSLIEEAIRIEKSIGGRMSEPKIKLPYEFAPEVKEKLIECAELQDTSATQLLIRLIEQKYQEVMQGS